MNDHPKRHHEDLDSSIPLNIAEGYGKRSEADRSRSYDIVRGAAHECAAVLDVARILKRLDDGTLVRRKR